jgi:hypothetical protein
VLVVVVLEESGGTTTVTSRGGGEPSPLLELQAAKVSDAKTRTAETKTVEMTFLCTIGLFPFLFMRLEPTHSNLFTVKTPCGSRAKDVKG